MLEVHEGEPWVGHRLTQSMYELIELLGNYIPASQVSKQRHAPPTVQYETSP